MITPDQFKKLRHYGMACADYGRADELRQFCTQITNALNKMPMEEIALEDVKRLFDRTLHSAKTATEETSYERDQAELDFIDTLTGGYDDPRFFENIVGANKTKRKAPK